ncbi:MAG: response regulator [Alphaproteobacteria bacterium]|nr:response regulator [Alphaproteobacteria bacterium]
MAKFKAGDIRVLVIDGQRGMRSILRQLLAQIGIEDVIEARNGEEALEIIDQAGTVEPDVIICDLHLDKLDGMELCNIFRLDKERVTPIIIVTGESDEFLYEVARQVGAVEVLTKPVSAPDLLEQIQTAIGFAGGA